jgi:tryptophan-rich sensory protein
MKSKNIFVLLSAIVICELAGAVGAVFTTAAIPTWYAGLAKPVLNPPAWVFAPVWTILYLLMGIAAFLIFTKDEKSSPERSAGSRGAGSKKRALWIFAVQLILNVLWTALFFGLHSPLLGLICIIALWLTIIWTMAAFWTISRLATLLLAPYLLWVTFAAYLNLAIFLLNR